MGSLMHTFNDAKYILDYLNIEYEIESLNLIKVLNVGWWFTDYDRQPRNFSIVIQHWFKSNPNIQKELELNE